jgi:hypothetical protein
MISGESVIERSPNAASLKNGLVGVLLVFFVISRTVSDSKNIFGLVVANTLLTKTYIWNLVTPCFFETSPFKLFVDIVVFVYASNTMELRNFGKFSFYLFLVLISCTVILSAYCVLSYFATANTEVLLHPTYGFGAVIVSFLMFERQWHGTENLFQHSPLHVNYQHLPVIYVLLELLILFTGFESHVNDFPFSCIALVTSWSYLRFYASDSVSNQQLRSKTHFCMLDYT